MKRHDLFSLLFAVMAFVVNSSLISLGEVRPDVYLSMSILIYYVLYSVIAPPRVSGRRGIRYLNVSLFIVFMIVIGYRVYQVLYS